MNDRDGRGVSRLSAPFRNAGKRYLLEFYPEHEEKHWHFRFI